MGEMKWEKSAKYKACQFMSLGGYHPDQVLKNTSRDKVMKGNLNTPLPGQKIPQFGQLLFMQYIYSELLRGMTR
jgi:hypothetical protein